MSATAPATPPTPRNPLADEMERIYKKHGELTAQIVLDEATAPSSPLHSHFTWDDTDAARKYRLIQAGRLIRKINIKLVTTTSPDDVVRVRTYVSVPTRTPIAAKPMLAAVTETNIDIIPDDQVTDSVERLSEEADDITPRRRYISIQDVSKDETLKANVLLDMEREFRQLRDKWKNHASVLVSGHSFDEMVLRIISESA